MEVEGTDISLYDDCATLNAIPMTNHRRNDVILR